MLYIIMELKLHLDNYNKKLYEYFNFEKDTRDKCEENYEFYPVFFDPDMYKEELE